MPDSTGVAKIVIVDESKRVLMLRRSPNLKKHAGEWDLPGGHLKKNEGLSQGLAREVKEETNLDLEKSVFYKKIENINFFWGKYNSQPVILSDEHVDYAFFEGRNLKEGDKFQKIAFEVLEKHFND